MKKVLFVVGMCVASLCYTLAVAIPQVARSKKSGTSIGTVSVQEYSLSGLNLPNFNNAKYVAKVSDGTYLGFTIANDNSYASLTAFNSTEESVTIPDAIKIADSVIPVERIESNRYFSQSFTDATQHLTIPASVNRINLSYDFSANLDAIFMIGEAPELYSALKADTIYVCAKENFKSYVKHDYFKNSLVYPYSWDFDWVTVNVEKSGEFSETYLTHNDYDWDAVQYLKVTGNLNEFDLSGITNLTTLVKLDLSSTSITAIPDRFMNERSCLNEVSLPSSVETIGNYAFQDCKSLLSFSAPGMKYIGYSAFRNASRLPFINLNGVVSIESSAFNRCETLKDIDLTTVKKISNNAFEYCSNLETINLQAATELGSYAFRECDNLSSVTIAGNLPEIGSSAFYNCKKLKDVNLSPGLLEICSSAFRGCTSLEEISIPGTVNEIGSSAFHNTGIRNFKCFAVVPPKADYEFIGEEMDMSRVNLLIPSFSKDFYRNTKNWTSFYLMSSIEDPIDYMLIDRPVTINLEEEDYAAVANKPEIELTFRDNYYYTGQLTALGDATLSAGKLSIYGQLSRRTSNHNQYCPTIINYADKMRADEVSLQLSFYSYYSSAEWHFISLPFDVKVADILPSNDTYWVIRRYDSSARAAGETTETWVNLTNDDTLEAGKGYIVSLQGGETVDGNKQYPKLTFNSGNSITKNNMFRSGDVKVSLSEYPAEFTHNRSWNFIGNPYPCYYDMHYLNEEFSAPVTVWNGNSYVAYSPVDDDLVLAPYEAFFVQCPVDSKEMTFGEQGRLHHADGKELYKKPAAKTTAMISLEERNVFNFILNGEEIADRARIVFNPDADMDYEIGMDASKFFAEASTQIFVNGNTKYSICERPVNDGCATLGISAKNDTPCTLSLDGRFSNEWEVILTDNITGECVDLTKESYTFTPDAGENASRFSVKFNIGNAGVNRISDTFNNGDTVSVKSVNGLTVYEGTFSEINVPSPGIYVITNGKSTRKAILK